MFETRFCHSLLIGQRHFLCHAWCNSIQSRALRPRPARLGGAHDSTLQQRAKKTLLPARREAAGGEKREQTRAPPISAESLALPRRAGRGPDTDNPSIDKPITEKSGAVQFSCHMRAPRAHVSKQTMGTPRRQGVLPRGLRASRIRAKPHLSLSRSLPAWLTPHRPSW